MSQLFPDAARAALDVAPPVEGLVYVRATVTGTAELCELPAPTLDTADSGAEYWTFEADTSDVWILFGTDDTVVVARNAVSTLTGATLTAADTSGYHIQAGKALSARIPKIYTHFSHISLNTSGFLRFYESGGNGQD